MIPYSYKPFPIRLDVALAFLSLLKKFISLRILTNKLKMTRIQNSNINRSGYELNFLTKTR